MTEQAAWMMAAFGDDREYQGNTGYDDEPGVVYRYDSFVPNHKRVRPGHLVFLHSRTEFIGVARIERIEVNTGNKTRSTCPECGKGAVFPRARKLPEWRCKRCKAEFDAPVVLEVPCDLYAAWFGGLAISNQGRVSLDALKAAVPNLAGQLSMQAMDLDAANRLLVRLAGARGGDLARPQTDLDDPLEHFQPKDSSDYIAWVTGRKLVKSRSHEKLVADFGAWAATQGFEPRTDCHPRDLLLTGKGGTVLVEAKVIYGGDTTGAARGALSQLLHYRYLFHRDEPVRMVGLFQEPIGQGHVEFLAAHDVTCVWREGANWAWSSPMVGE